MSKTIVCKDLGFECDHVIEAETEEDVLSLASEHAREAHEVTDISPEMIEKVKAVIRETPAEA